MAVLTDDGDIKPVHSLVLWILIFQTTDNANANNVVGIVRELVIRTSLVCRDVAGN